MEKSLKFCLVGRGSIGTRHLKNLNTLASHKVIAYTENNKNRIDDEYKKDYGIETLHDLEDVKAFAPDAFIIANPTSKHLAFANIAVEMGSHIFMEKPISHSLDGLKELGAEISQKKLLFYLANVLRFHPVLIEIKKQIDSNKLGEVYFARIMVGNYLPDWHPLKDYRVEYSGRKDLGGGVVLTLQHEIDYAYWLFGKFKKIKSFVKKISNLEIDVEDVASIIIEAESGMLIEIHMDFLQRPAKRTIQIQGSSGSIDYCFGDNYLKFYDFKQKEYMNILELENYDFNQMYIDEMVHFIKCISRNGNPKSGFDDGAYVLKSCLEIKEDSVK